MSVKSIHRRFGVASTVILVAALGVPLAATPAAAAVFDPPSGGRGVIVFPARDFISASGYAPGATANFEVRRSNVVIGTASQAVGADGIVEVNHPGGGCWNLPSTPDIRAGDEVRVTVGADTDVTRTADVTVTTAATEVAPGTVELKGTAVAAAGGPIPLAELDARLIARPGVFVKNATTTLRTGAGDGTLAYDAPAGSTNWTATFTGLVPADVALAVGAENRILWLGRTPGTGAELTIFEFGAGGGPAPPCTAPAATGPSVPNMTDLSDSGASSTDNITNVTTPTFTGVTGLASATTVTLYVDNVANGTAAVGAGGLYTLTPATPITINGPHAITASETGLVPETRGVGSLSVTIDTVPADSPTVIRTVPGSPGISSAPLVQGTSEPGSTVRLYTDSACANIAASGRAATFGSTGISVPVALNSTTSFFGTAVDLAGNTASACSLSSVSFTQDSIAPPVPVFTGGPAGLVASASAAFAFTDSEPGVTFQCSRDGVAPTHCTGPVSFAALAEGAHTFSVHAVDAAGNTSGVITTLWTVDTVAPTTSITSPVGSEVGVTNPTFGFAASEPGSTMRCSLDGAIAALCTTSTVQTSSGLTNGLHRFTVTATDPAGNTGPTAAFDFLVRLPVALTPPAGGAPVGGTPVVTPPSVVLARVIARSPAASSMAASQTNNITTRFSKAVTGVSRSSFTLRTKAGKAVAAVVTYNARTRVATLNPTRTLAPDTTYIVTLNNRIKIGAGKSLVPTRWSFTTGPRPTITARTPAPRAVGVARRANVTAKFGEAVSGVNRASVVLTTPNGRAVAAVVSYNSRTRVATVNPSRTLAAGATYTVRFTSRIKDRAGNPLTTVRWSFRTGR